MLLNDISRGALLSVKKHTIGYSVAQAKVIAATANAPTSGSPSVGLAQRFEIAQLSFEDTAYNEITEILTRRLKDHSKWRRILKALIILKFCLEEGSEKFEAYCRSNMDLLHALEQMGYTPEDNRDRGIEVRRAVRSILNLLNDHESLGSIRRHTKSVRMMSVQNGVIGQSGTARKRTLFRSRKPTPPVMVEPFNEAVPVTAHQKIRRAINNLGSWESALSEIQDLVSTEWTPDEFMNIVEALLENLVNAQARRDWTQVFKSLILLRHCLAKASPQMSAHFEGNSEIMSLLREFKEMTATSQGQRPATPEATQPVDQKDYFWEPHVRNQPTVNLDELLLQTNVEHLSAFVEPPSYQIATSDPTTTARSRTGADSQLLFQGLDLRHLGLGNQLFPNEQYPSAPRAARPLPLPPVTCASPYAGIDVNAKLATLGLEGQRPINPYSKEALYFEPDLPRQIVRPSATATPSPPYATFDEQDVEPIVNYFRGSEEDDDDDDLYVNEDEMSSIGIDYTGVCVDTSPLPMVADLPPDVEQDGTLSPNPNTGINPHVDHRHESQESSVIESISLSSGTNMLNVITESLDAFAQWAWSDPTICLLENPWADDDVPRCEDVPEFDCDTSTSSGEESELESPEVSPIEGPYVNPIVLAHEDPHSEELLSDPLDETLQEFSTFIDYMFDSEVNPMGDVIASSLPSHTSPPAPPRLRIEIPESVPCLVPQPDSIDSGNVSPTRHAALDLTGQVERVGEAAHALGGFSDVWRGVLNKDGAESEVAIKYLRAVKMSDHTSASQRVQLRMRREVDIWERLDHPNVVPLLGYTTESDGTPGLVCPWFSQGNILEHLKKNPFADRKMLVRQVADGLTYLHDQSPAIVHADVKGQNVLVDACGNAAIGDFGLSKLLSECPSSYTTSNSNLGSLRWCSPERLIEEDHKGTLESDLWAFAALALEILTGKVPFYYYENDVRVVHALVSGEIPARERYPELPADNKFWDVLEACWRKDPADRPTMAELRPLIFDDETFARHGSISR